ncbi:hypothetical protein NHH03_03220 [Stieleria sp. TO1_6]|uniref:hypothetical protein n=1 Tax=Stieleria tagensis TaxID=2956795 RepID=UPI00209B259D|nr:hypothetical protein [Stieleria tagensis]MCO8120734.1 hypothetical protein [Stieleria tagensis]
MSQHSKKSRTRTLVAVASLVVVLTGANLAQASHSRSTIERRQHPGHGLFEAHQSHRQQTAVRVVRPAVVRPVVVQG